MALLLVLLPARSTVAQDDLRDVVQLANGKTLRGRVLDPFGDGDLLLLQGSKRSRVPRAEVAQLDLVGDRVREFLDRRSRLSDNARAQWILVEWAESQQLHLLARLQAMHVALAFGDERAHRFLGHRERGTEWLWPHQGRWYTAAELGGACSRWPQWLTGERFAVRCEGELRPFLDALFDLERLGEFWYSGLGRELRFHETLQPVRVAIHAKADSFPKWGFRPLPYYVPDPHGDEARTFFDGDPTRPRLLFFVGTQGLLYRALIGRIDVTNDRDRVCPWLEIGLGMHAERALGGRPGFAGPSTASVRDLDALHALGREIRLTHLLQLPMYGGFYLADNTPTAIHWSAAAMFVQFLLDPDNKPPTRAALLDYAQQALGERRSAGSSAFDKAMGRRIETLEGPFRAWLEQQAGF